jgi:hypothetical protein
MRIALGKNNKGDCYGSPTSILILSQARGAISERGVNYSGRATKSLSNFSPSAVKSQNRCPAHNNDVAEFLVPLGKPVIFRDTRHP